MLQTLQELPIVDTLHEANCPRPQMFFNPHFSGYPLVTINPHKVREYSQIFGYPVVHLEADLPNPGISRQMWTLTSQGDYEGVANEMIAHKAVQAYDANGASPAACDATLLFIPRLRGFPAFFTGDLDSDEGRSMLCRLASNEVVNHVSIDEGLQAVAIVAVGVYNPALLTKQMQSRLGVIKGNLVDPAGTNGFGWDPCFSPLGRNGEVSLKSFGQMVSEQKNWLSMRRVVAEALKADPFL